MKKLSALFLFALICVSAVSCAPRYPVTTVNALDTRPTLSFKGAPEGAIVFIDGLNMGEAAKYDKTRGLVVEAGTHEVKVLQNNQSIFEQTIFVESEHKVINVH